MSLEYRSIVSILKTALKERGITYADVASHLGVSEQTIKRLFTSQDGPVGRLVEICDFIGISFFECTRKISKIKHPYKV